MRVFSTVLDTLVGKAHADEVNYNIRAVAKPEKLSRVQSSDKWTLFRGENLNNTSAQNKQARRLKRLDEYFQINYPRNAVERAENILSRKSYVGQRRIAGLPQKASPKTLSIFERSANLNRQTKGAYDLRESDEALIFLGAMAKAGTNAIQGLISLGKSIADAFLSTETIGVFFPEV